LQRHPPAGATARPRSERAVVFDDVTQWVPTPVYAREDLGAGMCFEGPLIVEQLDATTLVPPGARMRVDDYLNLLISV